MKPHRLLIMAFVPLSKNPSCELGAREEAQSCPCVCWGPSSPRPPLAAAQVWQPAPKSPVAMALQQHCREPRLAAHDTDGTGNLGMASRACLGANPAPRGCSTQRELRHLAAAADKAAVGRSCARKSCQCTGCVI